MACCFTDRKGKGRGYVFLCLPSIIQQMYKYEAGCCFERRAAENGGGKDTKGMDSALIKQRQASVVEMTD